MASEATVEEENRKDRKVQSKKKRANERISPLVKAAAECESENPTAIMSA